MDYFLIYHLFEKHLLFGYMNSTWIEYKKYPRNHIRYHIHFAQPYFSRISVDLLFFPKNLMLVSYLVSLRFKISKLLIISYRIMFALCCMPKYIAWNDYALHDILKCVVSELLILLWVNKCKICSYICQGHE